MLSEVSFNSLILKLPFADKLSAPWSCSQHKIRNMPKDKLSELEKVRAGFKVCVDLFPLLGVTWLFGRF